MALFKKPEDYEDYRAEAVEPSALPPTAADWVETIQALSAKLAGIERAHQEVIGERDRKALALALLDPQASAVQLADYAGRIGELERAIDNTRGALALAQRNQKAAEEGEAVQREAERRASLERLAAQYLLAVTAIDVSLQTAAFAFRTTAQVLDQITATLTPQERSRLNPLRSKFGATCAAAYHGLAPYLDFGPDASHRIHHQPLAEFVRPFLPVQASRPSSPPPKVVDTTVYMSESEALARPKPKVVN